MAALTKPIDIDTLSDVLGSGGTVAALCTTPSINMYSGEKPMRLNVTGIPTAAQKKAANYGYVFPNYSTLTLIDILLLELYGVKPSGWAGHAGDANYRALMNEWYYAKPRGINYNEWYRMLDFDGYDHDVVESLLDTNIPSNFTLGQGNSLFASIFQQQPAVMANFWEDSSHKKPMALDGFAHHAFGIAVASSGLTQARLQSATAAAQCGQWCKYYIWPSPVSGTNFEIANADNIFAQGAGTYSIVPFIIGNSAAISARNNIGSNALAEAGVIPLPCALTQCVASAQPAPTAQFNIYGTPTYGPSGRYLEADWEISYSPILHGNTYTASIWLYQGTSAVQQITNKSLTLNGTQSGSFYYANHSMTFPITPLSTGQKFVLRVDYAGTYTDEKDLIEA